MFSPFISFSRHYRKTVSPGCCAFTPVPPAFLTFPSKILCNHKLNLKEPLVGVGPHYLTRLGWRETCLRPSHSHGHIPFGLVLILTSFLAWLSSPFTNPCKHGEKYCRILTLDCGLWTELHRWVLLSKSLALWEALFPWLFLKSACTTTVQLVALRNQQGGMLKNFTNWDFPGSPAIKTLPSNTGDMGLIPQASQPKRRNIKQKQWCNKSN